MPKKSTPVRSGAQRSKPKTSKSFELVRPATQEPELVEVEQPVEDEAEVNAERSTPTFHGSNNGSKATATVTKERIEDAPVVPQRRSRGRTPQGVSELATLPPVPQKKSDAEETDSAPATSKATTTPAKGSASERLATRRQGAQRLQSRNAATLITPEHYSYVRRDLMFIAVLAIIMFIIIAVLYFVPGI